VARRHLYNLAYDLASALRRFCVAAADPELEPDHLAR
jgi:hypothetical protein